MKTTIFLLSSPLKTNYKKKNYLSKSFMFSAQISSTDTDCRVSTTVPC